MGATTTATNVSNNQNGVLLSVHVRLTSSKVQCTRNVHVQCVSASIIICACMCTCTCAVNHCIQCIRKNFYKPRPCPLPPPYMYIGNAIYNISGCDTGRRNGGPIYEVPSTACTTTTIGSEATYLGSEYEAPQENPRGVASALDQTDHTYKGHYKCAMVWETGHFVYWNVLVQFKKIELSLQYMYMPIVLTWVNVCGTLPSPPPPPKHVSLTVCGPTNVQLFTTVHWGLLLQTHSCMYACATHVHLYIAARNVHCTLYVL